MKHQAQVTKEYTESLAAIEATLNRLLKAVPTNFYADPKTADWADLGSIRRLEIKLKEVSDMVFNEGEYAN